MVNYVRNQGKSEEVIRLYEGRLKTDPDDVAALYVLSDLYSKVQRNPQRASQLVTRLGQVLRKTSGTIDTFADPNLAAQYVKAGNFKEGATMYEHLAVSNPELSGVYYKDAGQAWLKAGNKARALAAAKNADLSALKIAASCSNISITEGSARFISLPTSPRLPPSILKRRSPKRKSKDTQTIRANCWIRRGR